MALLCGRVDKTIMQLMSRWKSEAIFRYLHSQAPPLMQDLAITMSRHGSPTLLPAEATTTVANPQDAWLDIQPELN